MSTSLSFPQVSKIVATLEEKGVSSSQIQSELLGKGILADIAEAIVRGTVPAREEFRKALGLVTMIFQIIVDYNLSFSALVELGKYDWVYEGITEKNFPKLKESGKVMLTTELLHFNRYISSEDAIAEMKRQGLRPATLWELFAFGAQNPELQREFPIVALGSSCVLHGDRHVPCLVRDGSERYASLFWFEDAWDEYCRFLAVRI